MKTRIYNARILSMKPGEEIFKGEIDIEDNRITYVGKEGLKDTHPDKDIDANGNLVMPGFKDAHTHSAMTFLRSYADDMPLFDWLNKQVFPMEAKLTKENIYWLSKLAVMEYLTSGITSNFDMYFHPDMIAKASVECGFRTVMTGSVNNFTSSVEEMEKEYNTYNAYDDLISYQLGFHAEYTTNETLLKGIAKLADKYKTMVCTHNSETENEVRECIERYGKTPTAYLDSIGMFNYGGTSYHCVHVTEEDMSIFKDRGMTVVTNPGSNTKLASGIAPIKRMLELGINIAIGTDGPASNNCLDMFREMFLVTGLAKLREKDASVVDAMEVLKMATANGAVGMGLTDADVLSKGKLADIIMLDLHQPNMQPLNNIAKNIVYSGSKQNVKMTMVNGRILYMDGEFMIGTEPEEIYSQANNIINSMR